MNIVEFKKRLVELSPNHSRVFAFITEDTKDEILGYFFNTNFGFELPDKFWIPQNVGDKGRYIIADLKSRKLSTSYTKPLHTVDILNEYDN